MITCPTIAGVMTRFMGARTTRGGRRAGGAPVCGPLRRVLASGPGRSGEDDLALREVVGPHNDLLFLLPLERDHLVRGLEPVLIDLVIAEHRARLELEELLAHLVGLQAARALDALGVGQAARVPRRPVVGLLV